MGVKNHRICFDSSVWNALLNRESGSDLASIASWLRSVESGSNTLFVPTVVIAEVAANPDVAKLEVLEKALLRSTVHQLDLTTAIAKASGLLRRKVLNSGMKLKALDSLIIASAEHHSATHVFSYDPDFLRCNRKYDIRSMICKPEQGFDEPLFHGISE